MTWLPVSLLAVIQSFLLLAEAQQELSLDTAADLNTNNLPSPPTLSVPSNGNPLTVSVALCATSSDPPRFFVTNDTTIPQPSVSDVDNVNTYEIVVGPEGFGSKQLVFINGGIVSVVKGSTATPFEVFISTNNATSEISNPLLGDTTSNQALIFSPAFDPPTLQQPGFPNYTLPAANLSIPPEPSSPTNYTLVFAPTFSAPFQGLPRTSCAIKSRSTAKGVITLSSVQSDGLWLRDMNGWRWEWFLGGLTAKTNYTAYTLQQGQLAASKPINFVTKSPTFNCPLLHQLPFCPSISYAVPLTPPRPPSSAHTASTIPSNVSDTIISYLSNLTTTLTTLACGRDHYSPLVTCADCQAAYRTWLCTVSFPRCTESPENSTTSGITTVSGSSTQGPQVPLPAIKSVQANATPRNPTLPPFNSDYETLLPCLETCNAADRACPAFLGFKCPLPKFTASNSYGVGFVDSTEDGVMGGGTTGVAQDVYGNVFCNGS
ncbi:stretch-activated Ca2+-permeable channel component-domain-containing protein [Dichomitus squalens]|uniref:Stretch-activated Ca2+-permeable channel component-domain-containing protein n=1 Tax=Dichomitus squalens TaxID=114155 RepID=A0A4Q9MRN5_9APHY|nr:stretch-activated Ca2+-permeable channel component-domain-containing protein [Dichomitus squalens]